MRILSFDTLESTNRYAELLDPKQTEEFSIIWAKQQTRGIGQRGNHWESASGQNLTFSIILKPTFLPIADQFILTQIISLGIINALREVMPNVCNDIKIKWPNDIYVGDQKICGILISNRIISNTLGFTIVGIGLNVNQTEFPDWVPNPISMAQVTGEFYQLDTLLKLVISHISELYVQLREGYSSFLPNLHKQYLKDLLNYQIEASYRYKQKDVRATIIGTDRYGHLLLSLADGTQICCDLKEIQLLISRM